MYEDEKFVINLENLFPEAHRRVLILEDLKKSWGKIVNPVTAKNSYPFNLGVDELCIKASNKFAYDILNRSKGTIKNALKTRYNYEINENFNVKIFLA